MTITLCDLGTAVSTVQAGANFFSVRELNSEVVIDAVEHIQISIQNTRLLEF